MKPKGKLFALLSIFVAIGLVTATGAFTTVSADRTATVDASGDASALLALEPAATANGDAYAQTSGNTLELDLTGNQGASGVNKNAVTEINYVFNITNQGSQPVGIYITRNGSNAELVTFYNGTVDSGTNITTSGSYDTLAEGQQMTVSMKIDTTEVTLNDGEEILNDITINAEADLAS